MAGGAEGMRKGEEMASWACYCGLMFKRSGAEGSAGERRMEHMRMVEGEYSQWATSTKK